jgi:hypothetical protein
MQRASFSGRPFSFCRLEIYDRCPSPGLCSVLTGHDGVYRHLSPWRMRGGKGQGDDAFGALVWHRHQGEISQIFVCHQASDGKAETGSGGFRGMEGRENTVEVFGLWRSPGVEYGDLHKAWLRIQTL